MKTINFCGFRLILDDDLSSTPEKFQMFSSKKIKVSKYPGRLYLIINYNYKEICINKYNLQFDIHPIRFEVEANTLDILKNKFKIKLDKSIANYQKDVEEKYISSKKEVNKFRKIFG